MYQRAQRREHLLGVARDLVEGTDEQVVDLYNKLLRGRRLSSTVRGLNQLLVDRRHNDKILRALRRIGMADAE